MITKSIVIDAAAELDDHLVYFSNNHFVPTLAITFCNPNADIRLLSQIFSKNNIQNIGCSTAGEICDGQLYVNKISILLFDINSDHFKIKVEENLLNVYDCGIAIAQFATTLFEQPSLFVLSAGIANDGDKAVEGLNSVIKNQFPIFGGLAGDNLNLTETTIFSNDIITKNGLGGLIFDSQYIEIQGVAESGWEAIGIEHEVTEAEGNILKTINGQPALEVFTKYFGYFDNTSYADNPVSTMSAQYPLQVIRKDNYKVLRAPIRANEDGSMVLVGSISTGDKFRFSMSPGFHVIDNTISSIANWKNQNFLSNADALILVSCKGRHAAFGPMLNDEIEALYEQWKKPMTGFLSYGEIGNLNGKGCDLHNETCCIITIKSKTI